MASSRVGVITIAEIKHRYNENVKEEDNNKICTIRGIVRFY